MVKPFIDKLNSWMGAEGLAKNQANYDIVFPSPFYTFYSYPKELDYNYYKPNWIRFDSFMREEESDFNINGKFKNNNGKLIYFSLGTLGSCKVDLMKKFVTYFSEIRHRFIISKGPLGNNYDLPENCWGENMVCQTSVLPLVDLAIIHGGNNSLCETFYFGKPMIVMPIFGDQIDNAQRVHELGFGIRLNPFHCTKEQLNDSIEKLFNDVFLNEKLNKIAERSQIQAKSNRMCELIQQIAFHQ